MPSRAVPCRAVLSAVSTPSRSDQQLPMFTCLGMRRVGRAACRACSLDRTERRGLVAGRGARPSLKELDPDTRSPLTLIDHIAWVGFGSGGRLGRRERNRIISFLGPSGSERPIVALVAIF